jgi:hypothetical protein
VARQCERVGIGPHANVSKAAVPPQEDKHRNKERRQTHLGLAAGLVDIADRIVGDVPPGKGGAAALAVMALCREAAFWALTAEQEGTLAATMGEALGAVSPEFLAAIVGHAVSIERMRDALLRSSAESAQLSEAQQVEEIRVLELFARRAVALFEGADRAIRRRAMRRWAPAALLSLSLVLAAGGWFWAIHRDLAANRPWRASSTWPDCDLAYNTCLGRSVNIFFHTLEDESPWVEIDLGSVRAFSRVLVRNRQDCCKERAVPLAIEISDDASSFVEVARRQDVFDVWEAKFPTVHARYVRARALRRTLLHLEGISVR